MNRKQARNRYPFLIALSSIFHVTLIWWLFSSHLLTPTRTQQKPVLQFNLVQPKKVNEPLRPIVKPKGKQENKQKENRVVKPKKETQKRSKSKEKPVTKAHENLKKKTTHKPKPVPRPKSKPKPVPKPKVKPKAAPKPKPVLKPKPKTVPRPKPKSQPAQTSVKPKQTNKGKRILPMAKSRAKPLPKPPKRGSKEAFMKKFGSMTMLDDTSMERTVVNTRKNVNNKIWNRVSRLFKNTSQRKLTTREKAIFKQAYFQAWKQIEKNWKAPKKDGGKYQGEIKIEIDVATGLILRVNVSKPSGHSGLDDSMVIAIKKTRQLKMPENKSVAETMRHLRVWYTDEDMLD